ncbi:MAG: hypothetical protein EBU12_09870, partial [Microbacteriaceae bacterium]|nr:hypothetical protein [Microbacteriaceae bacterium]
RERQEARDFQNRIISEAQAEKKAEQDRIERKEAERKAAGTAGKSTYIANVQRRLGAGLIGEDTAQKLVEDYYTKYDLAPSTDDYAGITKTYEEFAPKQRSAQLSAAYQRLLGRQATPGELLEGQSQMGLGRTIGDIEQDIQASTEYKKQRPGSAFEAEMEARYGGPVLDETGTRTGRYKFNFGSGTLPQLSKDLSAKIGIQTPDFIGKEFTGSAEEIEAAKQSKNNYETFMYNSGLKSLEGNIETELTKLQTESQLKIGRQSQQAALLQGLVGTFNF